MSSAQICIAIRAALPFPANGPVRLMPKPIFNGCCACTDPVRAMTSATRPLDSQLFSVLIAVLLLRIDDAYTALSALSIKLGPPHPMPRLVLDTNPESRHRSSAARPA